MRRWIRQLFLTLTALAVGVGQLCGLSAGYLCECTGERTFEPECVAEVCHHDGNCDEDGTGNGHHVHHEVTDPLAAVNVGAAQPQMSPTLYFLPPSQLPYFVAVTGEETGRELPLWRMQAEERPPDPWGLERSVVQRI